MSPFTESLQEPIPLSNSYLYLGPLRVTIILLFQLIVFVSVGVLFFMLVQSFYHSWSDETNLKSGGTETRVSLIAIP